MAGFSWSEVGGPLTIPVWDERVNNIYINIELP